MLENELSRIWKSSSKEEQIKFDKSRLLIEVQAKVDDFNKQMKILYIREALGSFIAIPMFTFYAFVAPYILTKVAFGLIALWAVFILLVIKRSKAKVPDQFNLKYLDYLQQTKAYLEEQKKFRENILTWYVLPFVLFTWLGLLGIYQEDPEALDTLAIIGIGSLVVGIVIHYLNLRSSRKVVVPRLEKVNTLISTLQE
ncbi:hypothetical protein [Flammeovirga agarivorans]|uniref:Uncharacterized protein n=1 Tax=Flammeovirga agarivorans TaxID=2726742 RepID=A0A7X8SN88_9BACT|nr:hypothetical protein [Flammeovirga agarivorans]NLR93339.1 hypothetical protein [Flammeovirga agarivorans]